MRAPFQILAIPYKYVNKTLMFAVLHRSDFGQWQFVAGGGEDGETPLIACQREIMEETGITIDNVIQLKSISAVPTEHFPQKYLDCWQNDTYVVPEYSFAFECDEITLSDEHTEYLWLSYQDAMTKLKWDSNRTALYELNCRLTHKNNHKERLI